MGNSLLAISEDRHIYTAWTKDFLIKVYGPDGQYQHAFSYPYERSELTRTEVMNIAEDGDESDRRWLQQGELLAQFTWPKTRDIKEVKNGHVYAFETNRESLHKQLISYEFEIN